MSGDVQGHGSDTAPEINLITVTAKPRKYWSAHKALYAAERYVAQLPAGPPIPGETPIAKSPWSLEIYPTMACQIACTHCYAQERNRAYGYTGMPVGMMDRLHASVERMGIRGVQYCGGGEPLLWRRGKIADYIAQLPSAVTRAGMASNVINGEVLARRDVLERMTFLEVAVFAYDDPTYEIVTKRRGRHPQVEHALREILAARDAFGLTTPVVNAKILVNNLNHRWLAEMYDWAVSIGFDNIHLRLVDDYESLGSFTIEGEKRAEFRGRLESFATQRGLDAWLEQIDFIMGEKGASGDHRHCWTVAMGLNVWVLANGEVYVCGPQWGRPEYCIGNLADADLDELWGVERHRQVVRRLLLDMATSRCYEMGCRHIKQTIAIDGYLQGEIASPPAEEFEERHAWFL
jgi:MoaA/NifB/PqqE/SkfB family radical SAM enzyme